jgi:hypothetical protein
MAEADCGGSWYKSGFVSSRSGCCHCKGSCPSVSDECTYHDEPKPAADDHDDHDDHDGHDHDGDEKKMIVSDEEITCDHKTVKTIVDGMLTTFENYKKCDEETQKYTLEVSGYETELQAGKNGNWNKYGSGMMCVGGNMYYIYTEDTEQATWDALKASPPDESKVLVKCLLGEGSSGGGGGGSPDTTSSSVHATVGIVGLLGVVMMA